MTLDIRCDLTEEEVYQAQALRYQAFVTELGLNVKSACHKSRRVIDGLDEHADIFAVFKDGEMIATCQQNYASDGGLKYYPELYAMHTVAEDCAENAAITTNFIVAKEHRKGMAAHKILGACFKRLLEKGVVYSFIEGEDYVVPLYEKLGFRVHQPSVWHPDFDNEASSMLLRTDDEHILRESRSPFLRILKNYQRQQANA